MLDCLFGVLVLLCIVLLWCLFVVLLDVFAIWLLFGVG